MKTEYQGLPFAFYDDEDIEEKMVASFIAFRYPLQKEREVMTTIFRDKRRMQEYVVCGKHHEPLNYSCFTIQNYPIYTHILAHANLRDLKSAAQEALTRLGLYWDLSLGTICDIFCSKSGGSAQMHFDHSYGNGKDTREKRYRFFFCDERGDKDVENLKYSFSQEKNKGRLTSLHFFVQTAWTGMNWLFIQRPT